MVVTFQFLACSTHQEFDKWRVPKFIAALNSGSASQIETDSVGGGCVLEADLSGGPLLKVNFSRCQWLDDDVVIALARNSPVLQIVFISDTKISNDALVAFAANCKRIERFACAHCRRIGDAGVTAIVTNCPQLTDLDCSFSYGTISDATLNCIANNRPTLTHLNISSPDHAMSHTGIIGLIVACGLNLLSLKAAKRGEYFTNDSLRAIAHSCLNLEILDVDETWITDDEAIWEIGARCPHLTFVRIPGQMAAGTILAQELQAYRQNRASRFELMPRKLLDQNRVQSQLLLQQKQGEAARSQQERQYNHDRDRRFLLWIIAFFIALPILLFVSLYEDRRRNRNN